MHALYFLTGFLALLIALLFFGFIVLLWGLKQLLTIKNQNDEVIYLLEQISMNIWNGVAGLQEDMEKAARYLEREVELPRRIQG